MSNTTKVSFGSKVAFGLGMLANQMFPAALGVFMVVLVQGLGFPTWMWGILFFLPRVFDSITDPIMGFISDNTRSRWGRRRQYVFIGAIIMGVSYLFMWQLYKENGLMYNFIYFLLWSFVFYLGLTIFSVPYVAMGYEMSNDFHERTSIMAVSQWIGQWAWVIVPWFWLILFDKEWFESSDVGTRELAFWVGIPCMILAMVPAFFIKSKSTLNETSYKTITLGGIKDSLADIWEGAKEAFKIREFRQLCFSTFFIFNAFNTVATFTFFIIVFYLFGGDAGKAGIWAPLHGSAGALVTTFVVIPIVTFMSKKLGKKNAFLLSQAISIIGYILFWFLFIPGKPYMFLFALPFFSFGIGGLFTLMMSMTGDVCDLDELNTGLRREGIFGAIYWWMVKLGLAFAGLLSGVIMWLVGFEAGASQQTESAITGLRIFYTILPVVGTSIAMYIMWNYDLTEKRAIAIREELDRRKNTPKSPSYYQTGKLSLLDFKGSIDTSTDIDFSTKSLYEMKTLFAQTLQQGMYGICFSPYEEGQNIGDKLSKEQIQRRMDIVAPHVKWVRSFSCTDGNEFIPELAKERRLKTMVGAWIGNNKIQNDKEIENLIQLAKDGYVDIAVVGNEVLLREDLSEEEVLGYIDRVKKAIPNIPVGYVDAYYQFYERPNLVTACDVILINCYPFWEGAKIEDANTYLKQMYALTKQIANEKQVIITETGWANEGETVEGAIPSEENAIKYFINTANWSNQNQVPMFYFSSFDESWKVHHEGDLGARWGIWNTKGKLKY